LILFTIFTYIYLNLFIIHFYNHYNFKKIFEHFNFKYDILILVMQDFLLVFLVIDILASNLDH